MSIEDINKRLEIDVLKLFSIFDSNDQDAKNAIRMKDFPRNFAESAMAILGQIKPIKGTKSAEDGSLLYSATATMKGIEDQGMRKLLGLMYLCPPSKYLETNKGAKYAGLTPKALYAQKLYNDIPYMAWDVEDPSLKYLLGKQLEFLPTVRQHWARPMYDCADVREAFIGEDKPTKTYQGKITGLPLPSYVDTHREMLKSGRDPEVNSNAEKNFWRMLLQLWIANSSTRVPDAMILDPWDWDKTPTAIDAGTEDFETSKPKRRADREVLPF